MTEEFFVDGYAQEKDGKPTWGPWSTPDEGLKRMFPHLYKKESAEYHGPPRPPKTREPYKLNEIEVLAEGGGADLLDKEDVQELAKAGLKWHKTMGEVSEEMVSLQKRLTEAIDNGGIAPFFTGSHVYGRPTEESDIDLVVPCSDETASHVRQFLETRALLTDGNHSLDRSLRVGKLNFILLKPAVAEGWKAATQEMKDDHELYGNFYDKVEASKVIAKHLAQRGFSVETEPTAKPRTPSSIAKSSGGILRRAAVAAGGMLGHKF